jgi:hypothetical protein
MKGKLSERSEQLSLAPAPTGGAEKRVIRVDAEDLGILMQ